MEFTPELLEFVSLSRFELCQRIRVIACPLYDLLIIPPLGWPPSRRIHPYQNQKIQMDVLLTVVRGATETRGDEVTFSL